MKYLKFATAMPNRLGSVLTAILCALVLSSCSSLNPPQSHSYAQAWELRGASLEEVTQRLGPPVDQDQKRARWFLTNDSKHHPSPQMILHDFVFIDQRLVQITPTNLE